MEDKVVVSREKIVAICDKIRNANGTEEQYPIDQIPEEVEKMASGSKGASKLVDGTISEFSDPSLTYIRPYAFQNCANLTTVNAPNATIMSGSRPSPYAFAGCSKLSDVNIKLDNTYGVVPEGLFKGCTSLSSMVYTSVDSIGAEAYMGTAITMLQASATGSKYTIGSSAFQNCTKLTHLNLRNVGTIYPAAFAGCYNLTNIVVEKNQTISFPSFGSGSGSGSGSSSGTSAGAFAPGAAFSGLSYGKITIVIAGVAYSETNNYAATFNYWKSIFPSASVRPGG